MKKWKSFSCVQLFETPWTVACQAPLSKEFFRPEYQNVLPFSSPGDLSNPGIEPRSPALQVGSLSSEPPGKPKCFSRFSQPSEALSAAASVGVLCLTAPWLPSISLCTVLLTPRCMCLKLLLLFSRWVVSNSLQPMDYSTPGFPVLHHFLELSQTHVHWVGDAIHFPQT